MSSDDTDIPANPPATSQWSPAQLVRLENEWRRLQRAFAYHPTIRIVPIAGDPPDQFQVEYRIRTVVIDPNNQLQYANTCSVHIWLPPDFPHEPPLVRPITPLFHPNVAADGIAIGRAWIDPSNTLVDVVCWVGTILAWQDYDPEAPLNPTALNWLAANPQLLPIDPHAVLGADAGGDSLARICRFGPRTLDQIRSQIKQMCDSLLAADGAPSAAETQAFAQRTRQPLNLFLEDDVSESLRTPAAELDDFARELQTSYSTWQAIREHRALADRSLSIAQQLADIEQSIAHEIAAVEAMGTFEPSPQPSKLMRQLPRQLQLHQTNLVNLITRAEQLLAESRTPLDRYSQLPQIEISQFISGLQKRLETERTRAIDGGADARKKLNTALARFQPSRGRARTYAQALHAAVDWRSYADLIDRGEDLAAKVLAGGAGVVQRVYIDSPAGRGGPFELEQTIKLPGRAIAVRNPAAMSVEIVAADTGHVLAKADTGAAVVQLRDDEQPYRATAQLAGNCEELAVQLDYLLRESTKLLSELASAGELDSWLGRVARQLSAEQSLASICAEHERITQRWATLRDDLRSLAPFRERLATFRMVQRIGEAAANLATQLADEESALRECTERISMIVAASGRDADTSQLHIPAKYAKEYPQRLQRREQAKARIGPLNSMIEQAIKDILVRINDVRKRGFAERPALVLLGKIPKDWEDLEPQITDAAIAGRLVHIEKRLNAKLIPEGFGAEAEMAITPSDEATERRTDEREVPEASAEGEFQIVASEESEPPPPEEMIDFDPTASDSREGEKP